MIYSLNLHHTMGIFIVFRFLALPATPQKRNITAIINLLLCHYLHVFLWAYRSVFQTVPKTSRVSTAGETVERGEQILNR